MASKKSSGAYMSAQARSAKASYERHLREAMTGAKQAAAEGRAESWAAFVSMEVKLRVEIALLDGRARRRIA